MGHPAEDPLATNNDDPSQITYDPANDPTNRFTLLPGATLNYPPQPPGGGCSGAMQSIATIATATAGQSTSKSNSVGFSVDASIAAFITADYKDSNTMTTLNQWSQTQTTAVGQTASYNVCGPLDSDDYVGPTGFEVFQDNIYGTFMFYAPNYPLNSPGKLTLSPNSLQFPSTAVGSVSPAQTVTVTNSSTSAITIHYAPDMTFSDPSFSVVSGSDTCTSAVLQPNASCQLSIQFSPTAAETNTNVSAVAYITGDTNAVVTATLTLGGTVTSGPPSIGGIGISGTEGGTGVTTYNSATLNISGQEEHHLLCIPFPSVTGVKTSATASPAVLPPPTKCSTVYDYGSISVVINGFTATASYSEGSNSNTLAQSLANALNAAGSPVSAIASNGSVTITSSLAGYAGAYSYALGSGADFTLSSSATSLSGEQNAYDAGLATFQINNVQFSASWGDGDTPASIASRLAQTINSSPAKQFLQASPTTSGVTLTSTALGNTNWSITEVSVQDTAGYTTPSFSLSTTNMVVLRTNYLCP